MKTETSDRELILLEKCDLMQRRINAVIATLFVILENKDAEKVSTQIKMCFHILYGVEDQVLDYNQKSVEKIMEMVKEGFAKWA
jgi:hypothetical protein